LRINNNRRGLRAEKFEDHREAALTEFINAKRSGQPVAAKPRPRGENVGDLWTPLKPRGNRKNPQMIASLACSISTL
jgi:DNA end-binding protein Ku